MTEEMSESSHCGSQACLLPIWHHNTVQRLRTLEEWRGPALQLYVASRHICSLWSRQPNIQQDLECRLNRRMTWIHGCWIRRCPLRGMLCPLRVHNIIVYGSVCTEPVDHDEMTSWRVRCCSGVCKGCLASRTSEMPPPHACLRSGRPSLLGQHGPHDPAEKPPLGSSLL